MLNIIIKNSGEPKVIELTYENIWREVKDIPDVKLVVSDYWFDAIDKSNYICFLEPDCLVNSGYFTSMLGLLKKHPMSKMIGMMSSATGVNDWSNKFYGYSADSVWSKPSEEISTKTPFIKPNKEMKSKNVYPVQIGYVPGAIIHTKMLIDLLHNLDASNGWEKDLNYLSNQISLGFWAGGIKPDDRHPSGQVGKRVYINPNSTYVTTENYVNELVPYDPRMNDLMEMFRKESI